MPVVPWRESFSDAKPGPLTNTFKVGQETVTFVLERSPTAHQGPAPLVQMNIFTTGTSFQTYDVAEGAPAQYIDGMRCEGVAYAEHRNPGEVIALDVSVTWG
jgi:hypothetical protein